MHIIDTFTESLPLNDVNGAIQTRIRHVVVARTGLRYITVSDPTAKLSSTASLNANFTANVSNVAVNVGDHRFWVTDGGAVDNQGMISLLYVLREALKIQTCLTDAPDPRAVTADSSILRVTFIVADALPLHLTLRMTADLSRSLDRRPSWRAV